MTMLRPTIIIFISLISSSYAQIIGQRPRGRSNIGRIIAGCVVGALVLFALLILCCIMSSRRRRLRSAHASGVPPPTGKPLFGGPWGTGGFFGQQNPHQNTGPQSPYMPPSSQSNYNTGAYGNQYAQQAPAQMASPYNPEYPSNNAPAPPPAYGKDGQGYMPPSGPPPGQGSYSNQNTYTPPPGAPPAAHTTGQDNNNFAGGFRS
ncbi:hypothetical protein BDQ12DRAFT_685173 [Crucibulum laeve]|uniref:Uncharacterized protein n=1 Tax=Crucibulum laeve TaxID=68775 RepID=A0A5C3LWW8_9AGAR|nr:hypothetical protein BDQ12DRAFT_685173 [Crucibulum laeve]